MEAFTLAPHAVHAVHATNFIIDTHLDIKAILPITFVAQR